MVGVSDDPYFPTPYLRGHPARGVATSATCFRRSTPAGSRHPHFMFFPDESGCAEGSILSGRKSSTGPHAARFGIRLSHRDSRLASAVRTRHPGSEERVLQQVFVVPHQQPTTDPARGGPELPRPPEHEVQQLIVLGPVRREIEPEDVPALRDPELVDPLEDGKRLGALDGRCVRAPQGAVLDSMLRKKLLRLFAALSARAVVPPLECLDHIDSCSSTREHRPRAADGVWRPRGNAPRLASSRRSRDESRATPPPRSRATDSRKPSQMRI